MYNINQSSFRRARSNDQGYSPYMNDMSGNELQTSNPFFNQEREPRSLATNTGNPFLNTEGVQLPNRNPEAREDGEVSEVSLDTQQLEEYARQLSPRRGDTLRLLARYQIPVRRHAVSATATQGERMTLSFIAPRDAHTRANLERNYIPLDTLINQNDYQGRNRASAERSRPELRHRIPITQSVGIDQFERVQDRSLFSPNNSIGRFSELNFSDQSSYHPPPQTSGLGSKGPTAAEGLNSMSEWGEPGPYQMPLDNPGAGENWFQKALLDNKSTLYKFQGLPKEDIESWTFTLERYFKRNNIRDDLKVELAIDYLKGAALATYRNFSNDSRHQITWQDLKRVMLESYQPYDLEKTVEMKLRRLRQHGSVGKYVNEFNQLAYRTLSLSENEKLKIFIAGLKDFDHVGYADPKTLAEAKMIATRRETFFENNHRERFDDGKENRYVTNARTKQSRSEVCNKSNNSRSYSFKRFRYPVDNNRRNGKWHNGKQKLKGHKSSSEESSDESYNNNEDYNEPNENSNYLNCDE